MFTFDQIFTPVWDTDIVYGESFTMYRDKSGEVCAPFLYEPVEILEVKSADLENVYEEGKDWYVKDGKLYLTENSRAHFMEYDEVYLKEKKYEPGKSMPAPEGSVLFSEGHFFHDRQLAVTYRCKKGNWQGKIPQYKGDKLHRTIKKLKNKEELKVVLFGDSISAGANASGMMIANPFQPRFGDLLVEKLKRHYGAEISFANPSVGGKDSVWAMEELDERVLSRNPDLVIIGFGMNGGYEPEIFKSHLANMIERIKAQNSETEIILIATSTPNPILTDPTAPFYAYQHFYADVCYSFEGDGIAVADIQMIQNEMHKHKRFIDTTGNNVNHPNDFFIRIHAQILAATLIEN